MIHEYYSDCLNYKVYIDNVLNTVKIDDLQEETSATYSINSADATTLINEMSNPGFRWGNVLFQIGRAVQKAISGGSSAE